MTTTDPVAALDAAIDAACGTDWMQGDPMLPAAEVYAALAAAGYTIVPDRERFHPHRGDPVEAWLLTQRDKFQHDDYEDGPIWHELDRMLTDYRRLADRGVPLPASPDARKAVAEHGRTQTEGDPQ